MMRGASTHAFAACNTLIEITTRQSELADICEAAFRHEAQHGILRESDVKKMRKLSRAVHELRLQVRREMAITGTGAKPKPTRQKVTGAKHGNA